MVKSTKQKTQKSSMIKIFSVVILAGLVGIAYIVLSAPKYFHIQGQVEAKHYNISSKIAGRIAKIAVKKGDTVRKGNFIFSLDSPEIQAKLQQAKANQKAIGAQKREVLKGTRKQNISNAYNQWKKASTSVKILQKTYNRMEKLYAEEVISEQKHDEAYAKLQMAKFTESSAYQVYQLAKEGASRQTKTAITQKERAAKEMVAEIQAYAQDIQQYSMHNGEVTHVLLEQGELASSGLPVVRIVDLSNTWAVFNIREDILHNFKKGTVLNVTIPALGSKVYKYRINYISAMGDFATWKTTESGANFDMRSFEVQARPIGPVMNIRAGMSVLLEIQKK